MRKSIIKIAKNYKQKSFTFDESLHRHFQRILACWNEKEGKIRVTANSHRRFTISSVEV